MQTLNNNTKVMYISQSSEAKALGTMCISRGAEHTIETIRLTALPLDTFMVRGDVHCLFAPAKHGRSRLSAIETLDLLEKEYERRNGKET